VESLGVQVDSADIDKSVDRIVVNGHVVPGKEKTPLPVVNIGRRGSTLAISPNDAAPYASMLGIMLFGVGLMAVLNGWQRAEAR